MNEIHQQVKAKADLKKIWLYSYKEHGEAQADKYYDELIIGMDTIKENPKTGVACDYIRAGYRQYKINQHFVFYRLTKNKIHIIRILHESMKVTKHL
jgi:toxin ParE1/3/4